MAQPDACRHKRTNPAEIKTLPHAGPPALVYNASIHHDLTALMLIASVSQAWAVINTEIHSQAVLAWLALFCEARPLTYHIHNVGDMLSRLPLLCMHVHGMCLA